MSSRISAIAETICNSVFSHGEAAAVHHANMCPCTAHVPSHRDKLHLASNPSVRNKLAKLLQYGARGFHANPTARPVELMVWVHSALEGGLSREESARERLKSGVSAAVSAASQKGECYGHHPNCGADRVGARRAGGRAV